MIRIVKFVVFFIFIGSQSNNYVYAADSPPAIDYATLKAPNSVIAGEAIEIIFRATDDVGLDLIGPVASYRSLEYPKLFIFFYKQLNLFFVQSLIRGNTICVRRF